MNRASSAAIEKTEVFDKLEDIVACALDVLSRIQKTHDLCLDSWGPSAVLGNKVVKDAFIAIGKRGGKIRLITEISKANANYCTEFMKFAEVRHLDKVMGNFSISDGLHYTASAHSEKDQPPRRLIYSTVKEIAEQHQYFFETLWDKATPADQRIGELEGKVTEKTEAVYGEQNSLNLLIEVMARTKKDALACSGSTVPIFCMTVAPAKQIIMDSQTRGIRSRQITEITKENVQYCKEFMKYVELRHMPNIQGNMLITDNHEYVATASLTPSSVAQAIYSNSRTIVEQQRLFFENLWSKAVPAEQRIREIEEGREPEKIEIISGESATTFAILDFISKAQNAWCDCGDKSMPSIAMRVPEIRQAILQASRKGLKLKYLTDVTADNIEECKKLAEIVDLRHLAKVKANFVVSDTHCMVATSLKEGNPVPQVIYSNVKTLVAQQQYTFDALWERAIPAKQRIAELEQGIEPEFADVITDGAKAAELILDFAKSVRKEAQLILPQPKTMDRAGKLGMWDYLVDAANNGADIKVISPLSGVNTKLATEIMAKAPRIKILSGPVTTSGLFIHDEKRYLRAEDRDPDADEAADAISRVIYSNSVNGVKSFKSFFETLWKQSELYEQLHAANEKLRIQDALQKEFINIAAHELRTPVQPILGMGELLEYRVEERNGERGVWLDENELGIVMRNAHRLERLSSDILDIARIESGNLQLSIDEFDLNEAIVPLIQEAQSEAASKKVEIKYKPPANGAVRADKDRLAQVIWNLLNNALKFTENGTVSIEVQKDDGNAPLVINVRDSGKGIDSEMLPRLFTKFATKSNKGTGLGLYISKSIIDAHGGMISASNHDDGKGATFTVMIPIIN